MGDQDDRLAPFGHLPQQLEYGLCFLVGQHRGGLVQHQNVGAQNHQLQDLDPLLFRHGKLRHFGPGIDLETEPKCRLLNGFGGDGEGAVGQHTRTGQKHVFGHRKGRHQLEMLVHHADALGRGIRGA